MKIKCFACNQRFKVKLFWHAIYCPSCQTKVYPCSRHQWQWILSAIIGGVVAGFLSWLYGAFVFTNSDLNVYLKVIFLLLTYAAILFMTYLILTIFAIQAVKQYHNKQKKGL